mgnify:CR=1 FL=1
MMDAEARRALLDRAITTYGAPTQMDMAVEEMADVQIMLDQLRIIFHRSTEEIEEAKLERLAGRLHTRYVENGMIREAERGRSQ